MAPTPTQISDLSDALKDISGAQHLTSDAVGDLLGHWAKSSRQAGAQFARAITIARPPAVREMVNKVIAALCTNLFPPLGVCKLLMELKAPKHNGFRALSQYANRRRDLMVLRGLGHAGVVRGTDLGPFTIPCAICPERAFKAEVGGAATPT